MQFDFKVGPNQSQHIDVVGAFVKYKDGAGTIRVRLNGGGYIDLLPGQGVNGVSFSSIDVQDRTGAPNAGTILAGAYDFRDDRITGQVEVISGERARTLADKAFVAYVNATADVNCKPHMQLWNPADSGKNLIVEKIIFSSATAQPVRISSYNAAFAASGFTPQNKRIGSAAKSVAQALANTSSSQALGTLIVNASCQANTPFVLTPTEPFLVPPGFGLMTVGGAVTTDLATNFEYYEEAI